MSIWFSLRAWIQIELYFNKKETIKASVGQSKNLEDLNNFRGKGHRGYISWDQLNLLNMHMQYSGPDQRLMYLLWTRIVAVQVTWLMHLPHSPDNKAHSHEIDHQFIYPEWIDFLCVE